MKELSIFIDESGDFGEYAVHSPYYIITMVYHEQDKDIYPATKSEKMFFGNLRNLKKNYLKPLHKKEWI